MFSSGQQLWKLDGKNLSNKENIAISKKSWFFESAGINSPIYIGNNRNEYLTMQIDGSVSLNRKRKKDRFQMWMNGTPNVDGYFTITNLASKNILTASLDEPYLTLEGKFSS